VSVYCSRDSLHALLEVAAETTAAAAAAATATAKSRRKAPLQIQTVVMMQLVGAKAVSSSARMTSRTLARLCFLLKRYVVALHRKRTQEPMSKQANPK